MKITIDLQKGSFHMNIDKETYFLKIENATEKRMAKELIGTLENLLVNNKNAK